MKCLANTADVRKRAIKDAGHVMTLSVASVLTDKLHFGKTKTVQTLRQVWERFDSIADGYISVEELEQILFDEYGVELVEKWRK